MVERIVQVISGSLGCLVWPKQLHDLLPVEAVTAGEGEQLYQGGSLPEPPCLFRDGSRTYANPKATEQPDAHRLGPFSARGCPALHRIAFAVVSEWCQSGQNLVRRRRLAP